MEIQDQELLETFNSQPPLGQRWAINLEWVIVEIPKMVLAKIRANPTQIMGWFSTILRKEWKLIFLLTKRSVWNGWIPLTYPAWGEAKNPW